MWIKFADIYIEILVNLDQLEKAREGGNFFTIFSIFQDLQEICKIYFKDSMIVI